jgi:hypothetical protein
MQTEKSVSIAVPEAPHQQLKTKAAPLMGLGGKDANAGPMYDSRAQSGCEDHELAPSTKRV